MLLRYPELKQIGTDDLSWDAVAWEACRREKYGHAQRARGSIRDAIRQGPDWHIRRKIRRADGANWAVGSRHRYAAGKIVGRTYLFKYW